MNISAALPLVCKEVWGGSAKQDDCGVCMGDGSTCSSLSVTNALEIPASPNSNYSVGSADYWNMVRAIAAALGRNVSDVEGMVFEKTRRRRLVDRTLHRRQMRGGGIKVSYQVQLDKSANISDAFGSGFSVSLSSSLGVTPTVSKPVVIRYDCLAVPNGTAKLGTWIESLNLRNSTSEHVCHLVINEYIEIDI